MLATLRANLFGQRTSLLANISWTTRNEAGNHSTQMLEQNLKNWDFRIQDDEAVEAQEASV